MKVSELIKRLEDTIVKHGDMDVLVDGYANPFDDFVEVCTDSIEGKKYLDLNGR